MNTFFTSDPHYGHEAAVRWRGFASAEAMNEALVDAWNARVGRGDLVYLLGDVSFVSPEETDAILARLNGQIVLVAGNHDDHTRKCRGFDRVYDVRYARVQGQKIMLCHYPMVSWRSSHHGSWMLHGHCHGCLDEGRLPEARRMDVGVDTNPMLAPYSFEDVRAFMQNRGIDQVDHHVPVNTDLPQIGT